MKGLKAAAQRLAQLLDVFDMEFLFCVGLIGLAIGLSVGSMALYVPAAVLTAYAGSISWRWAIGRPDKSS